MKTEKLSNPPLFSNRILVRLIVPLIIEQGLAMLVGMADTMMVSSAGEAAISGVSLVDMVNNLIFNIFAALATGGAVVTSQFLGAKKDEEAAKSAAQLTSLSVLLGGVVMAFCLLLRRPLLRLLFGTITDEVMDASVLYFTITACSYPFLALYNAGAAIFRSSGNSKVSMKVSVLMNVINVCGNAFCIYRLHLGIAGVAFPTLISRIVGAAVIFFLTTRPVNPVQVRVGDVLHWNIDTIRRILYIGIPSAMENSLFQLGRVLVVSMISLFGTVHISANAVANNLDGISVVVGQAIGLAAITVVGQCVGAKDLQQVTYYTKKLLLWDYILQGMVNALVIFTLPALLSLYTLSPETVSLATILVQLHCGSGILLWPAAFMLPNALRATNDVKFTMRVSIASMAVWRLGFSLILCVYMGWGAVGVWVAMIIDWVCRLICFVWRFASGAWKKKCSGGATV